MKRAALIVLPLMTLVLTGCTRHTATLLQPVDFVLGALPVAKPPKPSYKNDLRVMSFNIRTRTVTDGGNEWAFRKGLLVDTVRGFDPDLLGVQECQDSQADYLRSSLSEYEFVGAGRNDGREGGEMCGIFFKRSKFSKTGEGHFWLSTTPQKAGSRSWGSVFPRMVSWVRLRPGSGREFYLFNTHFDAYSGKARLASAQLLRRQIQDIARGAPAVVTGDFNTGEFTDPYNVLVGGGAGKPLRLLDTYRQSNPYHAAEEGTHHGFRGAKKADARIDWILATPEFATLSAQVNREKAKGRYPSDHFAVTAVLRMPSAKTQAAPRVAGL